MFVYSFILWCMRQFPSIIISCLLITLCLVAHSQSLVTYQSAFEEQKAMLEGNTPIDFKRAVFLTEAAYYNGKLDYQQFTNEIKSTGVKLRALIRSKGLENYKTSKNWAVFTYMTDTIPVNDYKPCVYNFDDFLGNKDWSNMFVTKLMKTRKGNCHSLPYYYKILCEEIGGTAYLATAPNHVYIKHLDEKDQWVNIELTSVSFPRDQWIIKDLNVTVEEIKSGAYMQPLTPTESIAATMFDLACGYKRKYGYDDFMLLMTNTALKYYPNCIELWMNKADCYRYFGLTEQAKPKRDKQKTKAYHQAYQEAVSKTNELGYKEMPKELYNDWVKSVEAEKTRRGLTSH